MKKLAFIAWVACSNIVLAQSPELQWNNTYAPVKGNISLSNFYGMYQASSVGLCNPSNWVIHPGGAHWRVGDVITLEDQSTVKITRVNQEGTVVALSLLTPMKHTTDPTGEQGWVTNPHTSSLTDHVCVEIKAATELNPIPTLQYHASMPTLQRYGATLDNSDTDIRRIADIFAHQLKNGDVISIPVSSKWNRDIPSYPSGKEITLIFDKSNNTLYGTPLGDNAVNISYSKGLNVGNKNETNKNITPPITALLENFSNSPLGPYSGYWNQMSAINARAISGYQSTGNLSPINISLNSFGQNPASAYDVGLPINAAKYGQNSTWGIVVDIQDYSGKSPNAFSAWNEFDTQVNGPDIPSWDPAYGIPSAGSRVPLYISSVPMYYSNMQWKAHKAISSHWDKPDLKHDLTSSALVKIKSSDNTDYIWYAVTTGNTGERQPQFPVPARFVGTISNNVLTITNMAPGSRSLSVGEYVTGSNPIIPSKIIAQLSGSRGRTGKYQLDGKANSFTHRHAMYANNRVTDGTVTWQFGEEYAPSISSAIYITGNTTYDNVMVVDANSSISGSVLDTTRTQFGDTAASIRIGANQKIDLSGNGTLSGRNKHYLTYESATQSLNYYGGAQQSSQLVSVNDAGDMKVSGGLSIEGPLRLAHKTKAQILAITDMREGWSFYDIDDHAEVTYRCPTPSNCAWYPVQYTSALKR